MRKIDKKMRRTVKVPVKLPSKHILALMEACNEIYNLHVNWSFSNKSYNKNKAHKELYFPLREKYPDVPSALIQCMRDNALENIKKDKFRFKPRKSKTSGVRFDKRCVSIKG